MACFVVGSKAERSASKDAARHKHQNNVIVMNISHFTFYISHSDIYFCLMAAAASSVRAAFTVMQWAGLGWLHVCTAFVKMQCARC